ncbi:protein OXIDATIVE STRESS 3 LIKE 2-like isoform X2 [Apium graveolens]|uniref:protein OXIDATIVE STRESS 3 LIKE 2-like isoform X2 n=1 Tax=Apium graveolens TaxID=4045 RepID=UPI003D7AFA6A
MGLYVMSISEMDHCRRMENGSADSCLSLLDDQQNGFLENIVVKKDDKEKKDRFSLYSSSSESSIGKNSDGGLENVNDEEEVQSGFNQGKDGGFDCLQALDKALPIKGLSKFYQGKSKSYPRLAEAYVTSSIKDIEKPENMYSRKRKFLLTMEMEGWRSGVESKKFKSSCQTFSFADSEQCASLEDSTPL